MSPTLDPAGRRIVVGAQLDTDPLSLGPLLLTTPHRLVGLLTTDTTPPTQVGRADLARLAPRPHRLFPPA